MAKNDATNVKRRAINLAHSTRDKPEIGLAQRGCNTAYIMSSAFNRTFKKLNKTMRHVSFFNNHIEPIMITYDSGANGNYISKRDCI